MASHLPTGVSGPVLQMKTNVQLRKRNPETGTIKRERAQRLSVSGPGEMELDKNVMRLAREKDAEEKRKIKAVSTKELSFKSGRDRMTLLPSMRMRKRKVHAPITHSITLSDPSLALSE